MQAQVLSLAPALYLAHAHYLALSLLQALALVLALWLALWLAQWPAQLLAHTQSQCLRTCLRVCLQNTGTPGEGRGAEKAISFGRSPMPPFTRYDLPFRFERALQPDALRVVATCTIAVNDAIADATNAGLDPERDPAVLLLARHLGRVAAGQEPEAMHDEDRDLRTLCRSRIAALRSADVLIPLVRRGFAHDAHLTKVYRSAARDRLRAVAHALDLEAADYDLRTRSNQGPVPILDLQADPRAYHAVTACCSPWQTPRRRLQRRPIAKRSCSWSTSRHARPFRFSPRDGSPTRHRICSRRRCGRISSARSATRPSAARWRLRCPPICGSAKAGHPACQRSTRQPGSRRPEHRSWHATASTIASAMRAPCAAASSS